MFESILLNVLNRTLGKYISNLEYNQLKVGIWSGDVVLKDLCLKKDALDHLSLPLDIVNGTVQAADKIHIIYVQAHWEN